MTALRLKRIDAGTARLAAALGAGRRADLTLDGEAVSLELWPAPDAPEVDRASMRLATEYGALGLYPADGLIRVLTGIDVPGPKQCPELAVRNWALQSAAQCLPTALCELFGIRLVEEGTPAEEPFRLALSLTQRQRGWRYSGCLAGSGRALATLLSSGKWQPACAPADGLDALPVDQRVVLGTARLSLRELRSLAAQDAVLIEQTRFDQEGNGTLRFGSAVMAGRLSLQTGAWQFQFDQWRNGMEQGNEAPAAQQGPEADQEQLQADSGVAPEPDEPDAGQVPPAGDAEEAAASGPFMAPDLDDLPLQVTVEAGVLPLRLGQLRRLEAGSVLRLEQVLPPCVLLRCNGMEFARGELVEIDGCLAVQINTTEVRHDPL